MKTWQTGLLVGVVLVLGALAFWLQQSWTPNGVQGQHTVEVGFETDWISSGEKLANGAGVIWMRYDDTSGYCTFDDVDDLLLRAEFYATHDIRVMFGYTSVNFGTGEYSVLGFGGCGLGKIQVNTLYHLTYLQAANPADEPTAQQLAQLATKNQ